MNDPSTFGKRLATALEQFPEPTVREWERTGHIPRTAVAKLADQGIFTDRWAPGQAQGADLVVQIATATAQVSSGLALATMGHCEVFCGALHWLAETDRQRELRDSALAGTVTGCLASTEPTGGSDLAALRTTVSREGDGWRLRGQKRYISNLGGATHALVLAGQPDRADPRNLSLFVVGLDTPGATIDGFFPAAGLDACDVGQLTLDAVVPDDALLGSSGMGLAYLSRLLQFERLSICAQLISGARTTIGLAVAFARRREMGPGRLMDLQTIRHRLARCQSQLWMLEGALRDLVARTQDGVGVAHQTAALKLEVSQAVGTITDECLQIFGARGYTRHYPLERIWRDVRLARIGGGSEEVMTELLAARLDRPDPDRERWLDALEVGDVPLPDPDLGG
ncbi:MAG: acyl-CoA dehydrogenase family protein [Actinocatenispora sp.]